MKRWQKWTLGVVSTFVLLLIAILSLASGLIHRYIEKHDLELVGREITMQDLNIGWLTGQVEVIGFDMREQDTSQSFIAFDRPFLDLHLWGLPRKFIHFKSLEVESPSFHIVQHGTAFNFDDLLESDSTQTVNTDTAASKAKWNVALENYRLSRGAINYQNDLRPDLHIDSFNIHIPLAGDTSS
ncbi:MAG: hypothetical protein J4F31_11995 [Flavobacteriales bacterium]|nr:hypothetical protein [Flavobacteriales bacterium]